MPRGIVAYTLGAVTAGSIGTTPQVLYTLSNVFLQAGRLYLLGFSVRAFGFGGAGSFYFSLVAAPVHCTARVDAYVNNVAGAQFDHMNWEQTFTVDTDITLPSLQLQASAPASSSISTDVGGHMRIEDIGANVGQQ